MFDEAVNSIALKALVYGQSIAGGFRAAHERLGSVSHIASVAGAGVFARASLCFTDGLKIKTGGLCRDKQNVSLQDSIILRNQIHRLLLN